MAVFINNRFACLDLFDRPETLSSLWEKLLKSYAMEALEAGAEWEKPAAPDLGTIIDAISRSECSTFPSVGLGRDMRLVGAGIVGAGLTLEDRVLHLGVFADDPAEQSANGFRRSARARRNLKRGRRLTSDQ